jgi:glutamate N-acetyltransferase/amino-acid N-acetyltransferase
MVDISPLRPKPLDDIPVINGVRFASVSAGVRYQGRPDVMLAELAPGTSVAGVFTQSATRAAPVLDCQAKIGGPSNTGAAILVNSGNANAFTGRSGTAAVSTLTRAVSDALDLPTQRVFTASTGVIGEVLPHDKIVQKLNALRAGLAPKNGQLAAEAIMTTDTYPKLAKAEMDVGGKAVKIFGIAKGSGMIAPDMATMLAFVFTDAYVAQDALQAMLDEANLTSFNAITVDSDTSTSDTLLVAATGASGVDCSANPAFATTLHSVLLDLAHQVVRDGEGASKFVQITVHGAETTKDAKQAAMAVANSPLVKTAIAGEDPNWGRIVMAIGKSGAAADRDRLSIHFGEIEVARDGWVSPSYKEADGAAYMKNQEIEIAIDLGLGAAQFTVWTCDLTHGYISINADYRS